MNQQWKLLAARFAALQAREKYLICGAVIAVILLGGYSFWIDPAMQRQSAAAKLAAQYRSEIASNGPTVAALQAQIKDPDAATHASIADTRQKLAELDKKLAGFDQVLVSPQKMPLLLQSLLSRHHGLQLVSLSILDPQPAIPGAADKTPGKPADAAKTEAPPKGSIYRHGIEIKLAGSYQDLLAYVNEMEKSNQRLLLGHMTMEATHYPSVELTLTVYSLSLDRTWLVV